MELIGTRIGNVRVEKMLGSGGLGEVYLGFDEVLERPVAIKVMRGEHQLNPVARARFLREARVLSKLDDPHICRIYDMIKGEDSDFLVLEYLEGRSLMELMEGNLPQQIRFKIAEQIATALAVAHSEHIIHRDLKPENVIVNDEYQVKVLDFGLARRTSDKHDLTPVPSKHSVDAVPDISDTMTQGVIVGTLRFMSPEQARGEPVTEASDLFSFGLLLQELMTGKAPYPEDIEQIALYTRVTAAKTLPVEGLDPDVTKLIESLKQSDPQDRPTARETAAALRSILNKPVRQKQRRNWVLASAGVLFLLLLTAGISIKLSGPSRLLQPGQAGRIVILPFANKTGERNLDWVNIGLMDMVSQTVDAGAQLEVIPTDAVLKLAQKLKLSGATELTMTQVEQICNSLGSQFVITAGIFREKEDYRILYHLYDIRGFKATENVNGPNLMALGSEMSAYLSRRLTPDSQMVNIKDEYSTNDIANQNYAIGIQRLNTVGGKIAQNYFLVCMDLDPHFLWAELQLASCKERLTEWDESEKITQQVLQEAQKKHDRKLEAMCLRFLGVLAQHRKDDAQAEKFYNLTLPIVREMKDRQGEAKVYNNLATLAYNRGELDQAEPLYQKSLQLKRDIGDRQGQAFTLNNLAILAHEQENLNKAEPLYKESLAISKQIGDREAQALSLGNLATLYMDRKDYPSSQEASAEAMKISQELDDKEGTAYAAFNLAESLIAEGKLEEAVRPMEIARAWFKDTSLMTRLDARYQYEQGKFVDAYHTMLRAKEKAEKDEWTEGNEKLILTYQKAAREGRKLPLP